MNMWRSTAAMIPAALFLTCLPLSIRVAGNVFADEPSSSNEAGKDIKKQAEAEMQAAGKRLTKIQEQLEEISKEIQSLQRKRSLPEIRKAHDALVAEMNKEQRRHAKASTRRDQAFSDMMREQDERASGLDAAPPAERIRTGFYAWYDQGQAAASAFCAKNPTYKFFCQGIGANFNESFRLGQIDLMGWTYEYRDHFGGNEKKKFDEAFPTLPESVTIGYWPFAVAVHPSNPITNLTLDQLRTLATNQNATWKDLGRAKDGLIRLYASDTYGIARMLTGKMDGNAFSGHQVFNREWGYMDKTLKAIADDPEAIFVWHYTERIAGSGLKILPILDSHGFPAAPTDLPAVASGRYALRTPLTIVVHPQANQAVKQFAQWLTTSEAAEAIQAFHDQSHPADMPYLAHVTLADKDVPSQGETKDIAVQQKQERPSADSRGESSADKGKPAVAGAVAIMPTEPLSMYFLMANPSHHAAYEQAITDAIHADGRLKIIDRTQLARIPEEHKQQIQGTQKAPARAIIAADVFVFSYVASDGGQAYLQVDAIHGPTASLLGGMKLPIDPANPVRFSPPLGQVVATWWPEVVRHLADIRSKPIWTLVDVYAGATELDKSADAIRDELEDMLSHDSRIFLSSAIPVGQTQEELLLRLMGLSRSEDGRFSPGADYLLEARLTAPDRIELRLRGADLTVLGQTEFVESDHTKLLAGVKAWLAAQAAQHSTKLQASTQAASLAENDWALAQARLEYEMGRQLCDKARERQSDHDKYLKDLCDKGVTTVIEEQHEPLVKATQDVERYREAARQHYRRAAQLDPTREEAAYAALLPHGCNQWIFVENTQRDTSFAEPIDACERFLKRFPKSMHAQQVLADYAGDCMQLAEKGRIPPGLDERMTRLKYYRKGIDGCRQYIADYTLQGKTADDWPKFMPISYLHWLQGYIDLADPSEEECQAIVKEWSESYDAHVNQVPHSDFVRLMILAHKKDRPGFIALLTKMQQRWLEPKHTQWQQLQTAEMVGREMYTLFYPYSETNAFDLWRMGKRGIGDLPYVGYDPRTDDNPPRRRLSLILFCRGCSLPMRSVVEAYRKQQNHVEFLIDASPDDPHALDEFVRGRSQVFAYCGQLSEGEQKLLKMMHNGPPKEILLGYWTPPDPNRNASSNSVKEADRRQPLVFLAQPEPSEEIQSFLKWLATPEAREILSQSGVLLNREEAIDSTEPGKATESTR